jgi:hypothetical protein
VYAGLFPHEGAGGMKGIGREAIYPGQDGEQFFIIQSFIIDDQPFWNFLNDFLFLIHGLMDHG